MQTGRNKPLLNLYSSILIYLIVLLISGCGTAADDSSSNDSLLAVNSADKISVEVTSNRATVDYNGDISLDWSASDADSCIASGDWSGEKGTTGSEIIRSLKKDSSFVLTCSNATDSATSILEVAVTPPTPPGVSLSANPVNVVIGGSTTLTWTSTDATSCTASGNWSGSKAIAGSATRNNLTSNKTYTLTCSGPGGDASNSINITVSAPTAPIVNLSASPSSLPYNGSSTLSWTTGNVSTCNASGAWSGSKSTAGSSGTGNLTASKTYTLTCSGVNGSASDSIIVTVAPPPVPSVDLTASPSTVANNGSTVLRWTGNNVDTCTASGDWSGSRNTSGSSSQSSLTADKTYTLTCTGIYGSASDSVSVSVTAEPPINAQCPAMPAPSGNIINVNPAQAQQLSGIVAAASPGDTILLADGTYSLNGSVLWFSTPGVTLRSASGNPEAVILDGAYNSTEIITLAASNLTLAEITLRRAFTHLVHVTSSNLGDTDNTLIYRVNMLDPREQAIKINPHQPGSYADNGTIACSSIELTDQGRPNVNPIATGCYTGGIDAHQARGWTVRDNFIQGFWCAGGLSEHAIHFWRGGRDTVVERNVLKNNARGVGFGLTNSGDTRTYSDNPCPQAGGAYVGHYDGIIRNNFIHASSAALFNSSDGYDCGICLASACKTNVVHNTLVSTGNHFSSIEWRFAGSVDVEIHNNIATHSLRARDGGSANQSANLGNAPLSLFADGQNGDLHLDINATAAIDNGVTLSPGMSDTDIDGDPRDANPDIGADEY